MMLLALSRCVDSLPAAVLSTTGPELVDIVLTKIGRIEQTPLSDFKNYVVEEYEREMRATLTNDSTSHSESV